MPCASQMKALEYLQARVEGWVDNRWMLPDGSSLSLARQCSSVQYFFLSSLPDAPSRDPPTLSSDGAPTHESETTSHPPHATWHLAPNASTDGGTTTTHTGNCLPPEGLRKPCLFNWGWK